MNDRPPLFERLKRARIVQVLAVYLGASWVVLQIADVLQDAVGLPQWVSAFAVLLLLIGLVIILSTAWIQSLPSTTAREEAGEIPTDWEIAPADVVESLKSGKLPHLTWGRAIGGGIVALSLLFGGAGLYVGLTGGPGVLGPQELGAGEAAAGIAVVPFTITGGEDLELWREGMVDLLATNLDGMGGFRTIDSRTVMARWHEQVPQGQEPELRTSLRVAASTGARYAVVGSVVGNPAGIRVSADLYDVSDGEMDEVGRVSQEGPADRILDLTSALSVDLTRELLAITGQGTVQDVRLDALTTTSLPALRAYLEGEAEFRAADFAGAVAAYERAVELDSLFALAWLRLSNSYGWLDDIGSAAAAHAGERATALSSRLPARDRILVQASEAARTRDASFYNEARDAVRLYPDDPDLWFELGEYIYHVGLQIGVASLEQAMEAFDRAIELDPGFGPYQVHPLELAIADGDLAEAEARLERYRSSTEDVRNIREFEIAFPLLRGSDAEAAEAIEASLQADMGTLARIRVAFIHRQDRYDRIRQLLWANRNRAGADHQWIFYSLGEEGAFHRAGRVADSLDLPASVKGLGAGWMVSVWSTAQDDAKLRELARYATCEQPSPDAMCHGFVGWGMARSGESGEARRSLERLRALDAEAGGGAAAAGWGDLVEGSLAAADGRVADARRLLGPLTRGTIVPLAESARQVLAEVEWSEGNASEAIAHLMGNLYGYQRVEAVHTLARIYEARGDEAQALEYYRRFLTITREGDQDLPEIVEAKEAVARLEG